MSNYPVVLIPDAILQAQTAMPYVEPFVDPRIEHPGKAPQPIEKETIIGSSIALVIVSILIAFGNAFLSLCLLVIGAWYGWQQQKSYPERRTQWERRAKEYERYKVEYPKRKRQHELMVQEITKPEKVAEYRKQQLQQTLSRTRSYDGMGSNATKGYSETGFLQYLHRYFPGKIYTSLTLKIPNYEHPYTVDFAYIDGGLHIDIEIDEPYAYNTGEPTHFIGYWKDERRNDFFYDRGWLVIRFAEEQVCKWPQSCCKTIATEISSILGNSLPAQLANIPDLPPIQRWTESQAQEMARHNDRDRYLR